MKFIRIKSIIFLIIFLQSFLCGQIDSLSENIKYSLEDTVIALKYFDLGKSYLQKSNFDSSALAFTKMEKIYSNLLKHHDNNRLWLKFIEAKNYIGFNYTYLSRYDEAIIFLNDAHNLCREKLGEENNTAAQNYRALGIYYDFTGDLNKSLEALFKSLEIRKKISGEINSDVADNYNSIGIIYSKKSNQDKALDYFNISLGIYQKIFGEEHRNISNIYNNIGISYMEKGDYGKALEYYQKSLGIRLKVFGEINQLTASTYNNIGNIFNRIESYDKAFENHSKALSIRIKLFGESHDLVATSYSNLGLVKLYKKELDTALIYFYRALEIRKDKFNLNHPSIAQNYMNIGLVYHEMKNYAEALKYYNIALDIWKNLGETKLSDISEIYQNIAELYFNLNKYDSSLIAIQKSISSVVFDFNDENTESNPDLNSIISEVDLLNSLKIKAKNYLQISNSEEQTAEERIANLKSSLTVMDLADDLVDKMNIGLKSKESKYFLGDKATSLYELGIEASMRLFELTGDENYKEKAFYYIEKNKAGVLRQGLLDSKAKHFSKIPDYILEKEKSLSDELIFFNLKLQSELQRKNIDSSKIYSYQSEVFNLKNDYESLISDLEENYPDYYNLKYKSDLTTTNELKINIDDNLCLLNYFIGNKAIYIALLSKEKFEILKLNKSENFDDLIKELYSSILKSETARYIIAANQLSEILVHPVLPFIKTNSQLVIIPHYTLFKIPFEALFTQSEKSNSKDFTRLHYLIDDFDISYHYSASLFVKSLKEINNFGTKNFIGFAPVFPKDNLFGYTITNYSSSDMLSGNDEILRSVSVDGKTFDELKYSEWEVNSIIDLFSKSNPSTINTAYFYADAKEDSFKANVKDFKIVHIASHSFMNEEQPEISGVIFAQPNDSTFNEDGILYSGETYNLNLNAELVVLSSCESGLGKLFKGEGMMALTRGLFYSGTSNIVFSLWKIPDKHTSELMIEFYKQLISGKTYSESLRKAKLKMISNEITARPRSWAGFLLIGVN